MSTFVFFKKNIPSKSQKSMLLTVGVAGSSQNSAVQTQSPYRELTLLLSLKLMNLSPNLKKNENPKGRQKKEKEKKLGSFWQEGRAKVSKEG